MVPIAQHGIVSLCSDCSCPLVVSVPGYSYVQMLTLLDIPFSKYPMEYREAEW